MAGPFAAKVRRCDSSAPSTRPQQVSIHAMRRDVDGLLEAQLVFTTRGGNRLFSLNQEESRSAGGQLT
eukprot:3584274-Alexandrium_andersonii.AAC.1